MEKPTEYSSWELTLDQFLNREEVKTLRNFVKKQKKKDSRVTQNNWIIVEIGLNTGLRVAELADLRCGDIVLRDELSVVRVRHGKGDKKREVLISKEFQDEVVQYLDWKEVQGEKIGPEDVLLYSNKSNGKYSTRALQLSFKRILKGAGVSLKHSIHHLRHTYASLLYAASGNNLTLVQKHLGHSNIETTMVYAKVFKQEAKKAVEKLFG